MGGIIGRLSFDPHEPLAIPVVEQMLEASSDPLDTARGLHLGPGIAIGWSGRGTATPEPSPASTQCETLHASADAHLTNAAALRAQLERLGHRFRGTADDELILRAYEQWGTACFARLRGPFACAIWDAMNRRLVLARDQVGIRPLHFALLPDHGVVFASEIRALLRDPGVGRQWCPAAIDAYLTLGYVPAPLSAYQRISKLEPAHVLIVEGRRLHVERYWDLPSPAAAGHARHDEIVGTIAERLRRAVDARTGEASGLLYSGGTASTALLAMAPQARTAVITVALADDPSDVARSGRAASMLGRARTLESVAPDAAALAGDLAAKWDEPLADPSAITQVAMCLGARRHAEDALTAHGAATLWAGHARHRIELLEAAARGWLGAPLGSLGAGVGTRLQASVKGARALAHLALAPADAYAVKHAYGLWDDDHRRALYTRGFAWAVREHNPFARHVDLYAAREGASPLDRALYVDAHTVLPDGVLPVAQAAARAAGVRLRFPMLDADLVACAAAVPGTLKQHAGADMYALRAVAARELPAGLLPPARRIPARHRWLEPVLGTLVPRMLLAPRFDGRGIVSRPALRHLWNEHQSGRRNHGHRFWSLLMLEFWFRNAIDGNAADVPVEYAIVRAA